MRHALPHPRLELQQSALPTATSRAAPLASMLLLVASVLLWAYSLGSIHLRDVGDVGLISAIPRSFFIALVLLTASFGLTVANRGPAKLVPLHIAVQVLVFFGTPSFIEYGPRLQSSWRLAGVVDYISQHQGIDRGIDVFFNWPGFFILVSFLTQAAGLNDSLGLAEWAPMFFNLAYALPLLIMFRSLSLSDRQIWVGLWLFFAGNWIGQDYLSPQAFAYLMYLVIIAAVLTVFRASSVDAAWSATRLTAMGRLPAVFAVVAPKARMWSGHARAATVGVVILLFAVIVPAHQLTPWVVCISLAGLVLVRRLPSVGLPLVLAFMAATWIAFFTGPYLIGHSGQVAGAVGSVQSNVHENLGGRFEGNAGHLLILRIRVLFSLGLAGLAVLGLVRLRRAGAPIGAMATLGIAPFLMLGFQNYGGELLLRTFLFSLPVIAAAAAAILTPLYSGPSRLRQLGATLLLVVIAIVFLAARYGNERMNFFTKKDLAAVNFLYATAPLGSQIWVAFDNLPWRSKHYADYKYSRLANEDVTRKEGLRTIIDVFDASPETDYVLLTRSEAAAGRILHGWPDDTLTNFRSRLLHSGRFRIVFSNSDSTALKFRPLIHRSPRIVVGQSR